MMCSSFFDRYIGSWNREPHLRSRGNGHLPLPSAFIRRIQHPATGIIFCSNGL